MTGFIGVGQLKYILTNLGEKMSEEEVDELLKAVDTSSGQVNYTGTFHFNAGHRSLADNSRQTELVRTVLSN
jgi:Ca2+-binding EF-hand superfamily protein